MNRSQLLELVPHYVAMLLIMFAALGALRTAVPDISFWVELAVVFALVFGYRAVVQRLGYGPSAWTTER